MHDIAAMAMADTVSDMFIDTYDDNPYEPRPLNPFMFNQLVENFVTNCDVKLSGDRENPYNQEHCQGAYDNNNYKLSEDQLILEHAKVIDGFPNTYSEIANESLRTVKCIPTMQMFREIDCVSDLFKQQQVNMFKLSEVKPTGNVLPEEIDGSSLDTSLNSQISESSTPFMSLAQAATTPMKGLKIAMEKSRQSQKLLQQWDKKNGLPCSHCSTMMHTNRSRRQLEEERILRKWNGDPLIPNTSKNVFDDRQFKHGS
jgi:hypothetical protein